ncbi:MAG: DUF1971 domain-containing protein [Deltaproteobacteria bacterium]|nr:DUF1971 domain-containing protein [Deltaproteobacteria bacterium]
MRELPANVRVYKRTPELDAATTPAGLLRNHTTRAGVWGRVVVLEGELSFRSLAEPILERVLTPDRGVVIPPEHPHEVALRGPVRFFVEFLRDDTT